jgi:hypothetical protein
VGIRSFRGMPPPFASRRGRFFDAAFLESSTVRLCSFRSIPPPLLHAEGGFFILFLFILLINTLLIVI